MATTSFTVDMRAPLDRLKADMGGATGVVVNAARQMERGVASIGGAIAGSLGGLLTFGNVFATLAGATGIGLLIKRATSLGDELGEMAIRTGLSTTRLQELQFAASTAGVSTEQLDTALKFLNQRMEEAAGDPNSKAAQLFRGLNVPVTVGNNMRALGDTIDDLADSLRRSTSPTRDVTVATELMGRAGFRNLVWLKEGSEGLRRFADEGHKAGAVLGPEMIEKLGSASDSITKMANAIDKNLARAIAELTPTIEAFVATLTKLVAASGPMLQTMLPTELAGSNELERRLELLTDRMVRLKAETGGIANTLNRFFGHDVDARRAEVVAGIQGEIDKIAELIKARQTKDASLNVKPPPAPIPAATAGQLAAVEEARRIVESLNPGISEADRKVLDLTKRFEGLGLQAGNLVPKVVAFGKEAQELTRIVGEIEAFDKITEVFIRATPTFDKTGKEIEDLSKQFDEAAGKVGKMGVEVLLMKEKLLGDIKLKKELELLTTAMENAEAEARDMASVVRELNQPFDDLNNTIDEHILELQALSTATEALSGTGLGGTFGEGQQRILEGQVAALSQRKATLDSLLARTDPGTQFDKLKAALDRVNVALGLTSTKLREVVESNRTDKLAADFELINAQVRVTGDVLEGLTAKIARNREEIATLLARRNVEDEATARGLQRQNDILTEQVKLVTFVGDTVQATMSVAANTMIDAFVRGEAAAIKWGEVVQNLLADILKQLFQVFVIEVAIKAIKGIAVGAFGGAEFSGTASGGVVFGPQVRLVGEAGPEAIVPLDKFDFGGGGGDVTINIHPPAGTESTAQESTDSKGNRSIDVFITKIVQKGMAHGAFDRDMASNFGLTRQGSRR